MALTTTDRPPRVPLAGSDAVVVCDLVDLPAIGVGHITGQAPALPRFDLEYLISALEQARGLAGPFPERVSVGIALSDPHPTSGSHCLVVAVDCVDLPDPAVVVAGLVPPPAPDLCAGCPGVEGGCQESPVDCGRLARRSADIALLTALEAPAASLAEETARLKRACLAAEKILFGLTLLRDDEFAVLKRHGLDRTEVETVMNAGLLARHRVTRAALTH